MISVIVATYNWPQALSLCLDSLQAQTDRDFEVIIADDGSREDTGQLVALRQKQFPVSLTHCWHEDLGFRKCTIVNAAIHRARGDYLIFLDGDCCVQRDFVAQHRRLAEKGWVLTGSRVLLSERLTQKILTAPSFDVPSLWRLFVWRLAGHINKFWPIVLKAPNSRHRHYAHFVWRRIKGCNLSCWKSDALKVGGFDESLTGWCHEDADFVLNLYAQGIGRKSGALATEVFHLWHPTRKQDKADENYRRMEEKINRVLRVLAAK